MAKSNEVVVTIRDKMDKDPLLKNFKVNIDEKEAKNNKVEESKQMSTEKVSNVSTLKNGHVVVVGIGQCGANIAHLAKKAGFTTCAVNTSEEDIRDIDVDNSFIFENALGSGKERSRSKEKFIENSDKFLTYFSERFKNQDTVIIVHSAGGGTGGGSGPMAAKFLKDNFPDKNIFLIVIQGSIKEDIKSQENMAAVMEEIPKAGVNYLMFDNGRAYGSIDNVYKIVNEEVISAMRFIARENFIENNRSNIDLMDMQKLYVDNKRIVIVSGNFDKKVSGDGDYMQQMIDTVYQSTQFIPGGSPMSYAYLINVDEKMYKELDVNFRKIAEQFGEPYETYRHLQNRVDGYPDFTIAMTGLNECVARYDMINRRISEFLDRREDTSSLSSVNKVSISPRGKLDIKLPSEADTSSTTTNKTAFNDFI